MWWSRRWKRSICREEEVRVATTAGSSAALCACSESQGILYGGKSKQRHSRKRHLAQRYHAGYCDQVLGIWRRHGELGIITSRGADDFVFYQKIVRVETGNEACART